MFTIRVRYQLSVWYATAFLNLQPEEPMAERYLKEGGLLIDIRWAKARLGGKKVGRMRFTARHRGCHARVQILYLFYSSATTRCKEKTSGDVAPSQAQKGSRKTFLRRCQR